METVKDDLVTGATTEVELVVDRPIEQLWELVTDVGRIGEWSPECVGAAWRPGQGEVPRVGARFDARNEYPDGFVSQVECVVTAAARPSVFEWVVLDDDQDVTRPGSIWRYELAPDGPGVRVRHRFTHGPGLTGVREFVREHPDRARAALDGRLAQLRRNMGTTLRAMMGVRAER
jgi:uncharacterized protein YndB with AHSA1/START domain